MGFFQKEIETMPRKEIDKLQLERLKETVAYCYNNVPFYHKKLTEAGIGDGSKIKQLSDIQYIPFTTKDDFRDNYPFGMAACSMRDVVRIHASSGTTGKPTVGVYTKDDIDIWSDCVARVAAAGGVSDNDIIQISFGYGLFTGALGLHYGLEKLGATVCENQGANGIKTARWALDHVLDRSASPAETKVALALTLPCKIGGMGLPQPSLNRFIPLNAAEQKALNRSYFLCDLYWEQAKLAIEYDSDAEHSGSERIASDAARRNALLRLGITVITVGNQTFRDRSEFKRVGATVARLLGTRIRPRSEHYDRRQIELRKRLSSQPIWESARHSE